MVIVGQWKLIETKRIHIAYTIMVKSLIKIPS